jgi:tetratricopeptide (TPR) repeat protein
VELLPAKEKKKYTSMNHKLTPSEIAEAEADLSSWRRAAQQTDEVLAKDKQADTSAKKKKVVPVRGSARTPAAEAGVSEGVSEAKGSPGREGEGAALLSVRAVSDLRAGAIGPDIAALLNVSQKKKLEKLQKDLAVFVRTEVQREYKAGLEKTKGNESFRIADNEDALLCYSRSIAYDPRNSVVWANRAMAYIRTELFDLAEADAGVALLLDPAYTKAYSRRGLVRFKRGKYREAVQDFRCALDLDGGNAELGKLLEAARQKHAEVEGVALTEAQ